MTIWLPTIRRAATVLVLAALTAAALLSGCGSTNAAPQTDSAGATISEVTTISGQSMAIPDGKPAALFFYWIGCPSCIEGVKAFTQAAHDDAGSADFLAVDQNPDESPEDVKKLLAMLDAAQLPAVIDADGELALRFHVSAPSTLVVVDASGAVTEQTSNPSAQAITDAVNKAGA